MTELIETIIKDRWVIYLDDVSTKHQFGYMGGIFCPEPAMLFFKDNKCVKKER